MANSETIFGLVTAVSTSGPVSPGSATYSIAIEEPGGTVIPATDGHVTSWGYLWPGFAKVAPERLIGYRVRGIRTAAGRIVWEFPEPIFGTQCPGGPGGGSGGVRAPMPGDVRVQPPPPPPPPPGGGGTVTGSTPAGGEAAP